jgi:hypothetical protein
MYHKVFFCTRDFLRVSKLTLKRKIEELQKNEEQIGCSFGFRFGGRKFSSTKRSNFSFFLICRHFPCSFVFVYEINKYEKVNTGNNRERSSQAGQIADSGSIVGLTQEENQRDSNS